MKILTFATYVLMFGLSCSQALAQDCKPHRSWIDPISKQQLDMWYQTVSKSGVAVTIYVGRRTAEGAQVGVVIEKQEAVATTNTQFQSALHAVKGNQFYFGLKSGEPLTFAATDVSNEAKVSGSFMAGFTGKNLVTVVQIWAVVPNKDLAVLKEALTQKQIDAIRIILAGDVRIEKIVDDKDGKKMMDNFSCFYQSLEKASVNFSTAADPPKKAEPQKTATQLTIDKIIEMVGAKLPDDIVISQIQKTNSKFDLTPEDLIKLKKAGVSDAVIRAMSP